jgi:hypothetical protein
MREWWVRLPPTKKREYLDKRPPARRTGGVSRDRWRSKPLEQRRAHWTVHNAIRDGRLERQPCEICGVEKTDAHHDDYSKPLEVRWLCRKHHGIQHRKYHTEEEAS